MNKLPNDERSPVDKWDANKLIGRGGALSGFALKAIAEGAVYRLIALAQRSNPAGGEGAGLGDEGRPAEHPKD